MVTRPRSRKSKKTEEALPNNPFTQDAFINVGDFCIITTTELLSDKVATGDYVWVAGVRAVPLTEEDPYTQRIVMLVHRLINEHIQSDQLYVIDPVALTKTDSETKKRLHNQLELDYPTKIETGDASIN